MPTASSPPVEHPLQRDGGVDAARHRDGRSRAGRRRRERIERVRDGLGEGVEGDGRAVAARRGNRPLGEAVGEAESVRRRAASRPPRARRTTPRRRSRPSTRAHRSAQPRSARRPPDASWTRTRSPHADPPAAPSPSAPTSRPARARSRLPQHHTRTAALARRSELASVATAASETIAVSGIVAARRTCFAARRARATVVRPWPRGRRSARPRCSRTPHRRRPRSPRSSSSAQSVSPADIADQREAVSRKARGALGCDLDVGNARPEAPAS